MVAPGALVAGELLGGHPVHPPDSGQTTVFLVVLGTGIDPRELSLDAFASLLLDFQSFAMVDLSACVARFLARMGFEVTRTEDSTSGWRAQDGAAVTVHWLPSGAIAAITLTSPRAATG